MFQRTTRLARIVVPGLPHHLTQRGRWSGHLFQSRFASVAMDEARLMAAVRYVSLNPVRAGPVRRARDWPWSSVRAHLAGEDDELVNVGPVLEREPEFARLLDDGREDGFLALRRPEGTGRPAGAADSPADRSDGSAGPWRGARPAASPPAPTPDNWT